MCFLKSGPISLRFRTNLTRLQVILKALIIIIRIGSENDVSLRRIFCHLPPWPQTTVMTVERTWRTNFINCVGPVNCMYLVLRRVLVSAESVFLEWKGEKTAAIFLCVSPFGGGEGVSHPLQSTPSCYTLHYKNQINAICINFFSAIC